MKDNEKLVSLVKKAQQGDTRAFNELMNECYQGFYFFALKTCGNKQKAEEVTQDSCLEIVKTIRKLKAPEAFLNWAHQIIYHHCLRHTNKNKKEVLAQVDDEELTIFDCVPADYSESLPEQVYEDKMFREEMMEMLNALPDEQRSALVLHYFENRSVKEIAEIQNTTEGTVKSRLYYGRKEMKNRVEDYEKRNGVKFHGILPLSMLLFHLFRYSAMETTVSISPALSAMLAEAMAGSSVATATSAAATASATGATSGAATAAGTAAAKGIGSALLTKLLIGAAAVAVTVGSVVGGFLLTNEEEKEPAESSPIVEESTEIGLGDTSGNNSGNNSGNSSHNHLFAFTGESDHNYHEVVCPCGEKQKQLHTYKEDKCAVCNNENYFYYSIDPEKGTCSINGVMESHEVIAIPAMIDDCRVTSIRDSAFSETASDTDGLKEVYLPEGIETIGEFAFKSCDELETVVIPNSVTTIQKRAFADCENLNKIVIPASVTTLEDFVFTGCTGLSDFTYQGTIAEWDALDKDNICTFLSTNVEQIKCSDVVRHIGFFFEVNEDGKTCTLTSAPYYSTHLVIPAYLDGYRVTHIGTGDENIQDGYANNCTEEITIPEGVVEIRDMALDDFWELKTVHLPDSLITIGNQAFAGSDLSEILIPDSVTAIGERAFSGSNIAEIRIPDSVKTIGDCAFINCIYLESIVIPDSVISLGAEIFEGCEVLKNATFEGTLEQWKAMNVEVESFFGKTLVEYLQCADGKIIWGYEYEVNEDGVTCTITKILHKLEHSTIPESIDGYRVTRLGDGSSALQTNWMSPPMISITIPEGVQEIRDNAFNGFSNMTEVRLPSTLQRIGERAFRNCSFTTISIPHSVTEIGQEAFAFCDLQTVTIPRGTTVLNEGLFNSCSYLTEVILHDGITEIKADAFAYCKALSRVEIPNSVTQIGNAAFRDCSNLKEVIVSNAVTSIGDWTFVSCGRLEKITLSGDVNYIGVNSLRGCESLSTIVFGGTMADWTSIQFGDYWNMSTGAYTVHCTNGTIEK